MRFKKLVSLAVCFILGCGVASALVGCRDDNTPKSAVSPLTPQTSYDVTSDSLYVKKVENIPEGFVMGMDASAVISLEQSGVKYYDYDGNEADVFKTLAENGINTIRVRVWNDPYDANGKGYGGGNNDIDKAVEIGKRATAHGMNLMVDFHYSDFWADPSKQMVPKAWKNMNLTQKVDALYEFTKSCMNKLNDANVAVNIVQIGNETNGKICGETVWNAMSKLYKAGIKAVRETNPKALVALHFANPEKITNYRDYAGKLKDYYVDYDIFASSYYPYWHGTLDNLTSLLSEIATTYNKKVMVAETSYAYTAEDSDFFGNTIGEGSAVTKNYPYSVQGQANCVRDIIEATAKMTDGIGVCYWEGTWISVGGANYDANKALWEAYGSGWASSYATDYDPDDAGKWYGGCAVDNQAFFDAEGKPLESLKVWALVRKGNNAEVKVDALEDLNLMVVRGKPVVLPTQVNAVMSDNSKMKVDVAWNVTPAQLAEMSAVDEPTKFTIRGTAGGMTATCYLAMIDANYLTNYSFEDDDNQTATPTGWTVMANKKCDEMYVEDKVTDSLTGTKHYHFYGSTANAVDFTLEQEVKNLSAGKYKYSISIMGGAGGTMDIYAYIKVGGEIVETYELTMTVWEEWHTALIEYEYDGEGAFVVGISVKCGGAGAWGKIDDALLNDAE